MVGLVQQYQDVVSKIQNHNAMVDQIIGTPGFPPPSDCVFKANALSSVASYYQQCAQNSLETGNRIMNDMAGSVIDLADPLIKLNKYCNFLNNVNSGSYFFDINISLDALDLMLPLDFMNFDQLNNYLNQLNKAFNDMSAAIAKKLKEMSDKLKEFLDLDNKEKAINEYISKITKALLNLTDPIMDCLNVVEEISPGFKESNGLDVVDDLRDKLKNGTDSSDVKSMVLEKARDRYDMLPPVI